MIDFGHGTLVAFNMDANPQRRQLMKRKNDVPEILILIAIIAAMVALS